MVMIKDKDGIERYSISSALYGVVERIREKMYNEDSEVWGCLFGARGSGKTLKAMWIANAVKPDLDLSVVCHTKEEFITAVKNNSKRCIIVDEAVSVFFGRASMTKEGREVAEVADQIRQKNLCVLLCIPNILSLDWMILEALNFCAYVYEDNKMINGRIVRTKGNMAMWLKLPHDDGVAKVIDYKRKKRNNPLRSPIPPEAHIDEPGNPVGDSFKKPWYPVPENLYRAKKEAILNKYGSKDDNSKDDVYNQDIDYSMMDALIHAKFKIKEIAKRCQCSEITVKRRKKKVSKSIKK